MGCVASLSQGGCVICAMVGALFCDMVGELFVTWWVRYLWHGGCASLTHPTNHHPRLT